MNSSKQPISETMAQATDAARKAFGDDIAISVARAPAFGNDDTMVLVYGKRQAEAAAGIARFAKGAKVQRIEGTCFFTGEPRAHTQVAWGAA